MIRINNREIRRIYHRSKALTAVYYGEHLVWGASDISTTSCFGTGAWINAYPWVNGDTWGDSLPSSSFGTGTWLNAKPWINSDTWKNN